MATAKKMPSGNYRVKVYVGKSSEGKNQYKSVTAGTKWEAERLAADIKIQNRPATSFSGMTFRESIDLYIDTRSPVLSPNTIVGYRRIARSLPGFLLDKKRDSITRQDIQLAVGEITKGHSPKTVRNAHGLISAVMREYRPDFVLNTKLPQKKKPTICVPIDEDIQKLAAFFEGRTMEIPFLLATFGPLRRSEICAVTFADLNGDVLQVNNAYAKTEDKEWIIKQPKTDNGYRDVPLPQFVVGKIMDKYVGNPTDRICPLYPDTITGYWDIARERLGLNKNMRFHDLRHYCASRLHALGVPDEDICSRGGWTMASLLRIYRHSLKDRARISNNGANQEFAKIYSGKSKYIPQNVPDDAENALK